MIIPIRCFTCGNVIASKYKKYKELLAQKKNQVDSGKIENDWMINKNLNIKKEHILVTHNVIENNIYNLSMEEAGVRRYCCKRHILGHVEILTLI